MAKVVLKDASIVVNTVDLSTRCDQITIEDSAEEVDVTTFQGNGYREFMQGLKDATVTASFFQDFASGSVHSTLNAVYQSGATFDVVIKGDDAAVSATNPSFTITCRLFSYSPISGSVGEPSKIEATFRNADDGVTVATS
jgi:hypothetical protein